MSALHENNEWTQIYLLEGISRYSPTKQDEINEIIERVIPYVSHSNAGVALSVIKILIKLLDKVENPETIRSVCKKITDRKLDYLLENGIDHNYEDEYENELNEVNKKLEELKKIIDEKEKKINEEKKNIKKLKELILNNTSNINTIKELMNKTKLNIINDIKLNIPLQIKSEEKMMSIIFISIDEDIHYSIICKNTDIFSNIEKIFYDKYPEYKNTQSEFFINGNKVDRFKNIDDNKIKNSDIITFKPFK